MQAAAAQSEKPGDGVVADAVTKTEEPEAEETQTVSVNGIALGYMCVLLLFKHSPTSP